MKTISAILFVTSVILATIAFNSCKKSNSGTLVTHWKLSEYVDVESVPGYPAATTTIPGGPNDYWDFNANGVSHLFIFNNDVTFNYIINGQQLILIDTASPYLPDTFQIQNLTSSTVNIYHAYSDSTEAYSETYKLYR